MNQSQPSESNFISLSAFVQSLKKQKVAENSIESYISDLKGFLQSQDISVDSIEPAAIVRIQQQHIESYLQHLIGKSVKYSTIRRILASIRRFFFFLEDEGYHKNQSFTGNPSPFDPKKCFHARRSSSNLPVSRKTSTISKYNRSSQILPG